MDLTCQSPSVNSARMTVLGTSTRTIGSETMSSTTTIGRLAAIAVAVGAGLAVASAPASAGPTQSGAHLFLGGNPPDGGPGTTQVTIDGVFSMLEADAVGYLNNIYTGKNPGGMEYRLHADDNGEGDRNIVYRWVAGNGSFPGYRLTATPRGIEHSFVFNVPTRQFNEDNGAFDDDDEIYAEATFVDADGGRRSQISNVITGRF
jgi:hypothetical protein